MNWLHRFSTNRQVLEVASFLLVGGLSALFYIVISAELTILGIRPSTALLITLFVLVPPTYLAQRRLTFQSDLEHLIAFPRYVTTQVTGNGMGLLGTLLFPDAIVRQPFLAFTIVAIGVATFNYGCLKLWAFRR